jgi:hypothetical protein
MKKLLCIAALLVLTILDVSAQGNAVYKFKGKLGEKFPIVMELCSSGVTAWGDYYYTSQGASKKLVLNGESDFNEGTGIMWTLKETVNGQFNGVFMLVWDRRDDYAKNGHLLITGTYFNAKHQQFSVLLKCYEDGYYYDNTYYKSHSYE